MEHREVNDTLGKDLKRQLKKNMQMANKHMKGAQLNNKGNTNKKKQQNIRVLTRVAKI